MRSELILDAAVDAFHHGAFRKALLFGRCERKPLAVLSGGRFAPCIIAPQTVLAAFGDRDRCTVGCNQRNVPQASDVRMNLLGIVGALANRAAKQPSRDRKSGSTHRRRPGAACSRASSADVRRCSSSPRDCSGAAVLLTFRTNFAAAGEADGGRKEQVGFAQTAPFAFRNRFVFRTSREALARRNGGGIARSVTHQASPLRRQDQRFMQTQRQLGFSKLLKGAGQGRLMGNPLHARPAAQATQLPVRMQTLQQLPGSFQTVHRLGYKR